MMPCYIMVGASGAMPWRWCEGRNRLTILRSIVCLMVVNKPGNCEAVTFSTVAQRYSSIRLILRKVRRSIPLKMNIIRSHDLDLQEK